MLLESLRDRFREEVCFSLGYGVWYRAKLIGAEPKWGANRVKVIEASDGSQRFREWLQSQQEPVILVSSKVRLIKKSEAM